MSADLLEQFAEYEDDVGFGEDDKKFVSKNNTEWFKGEKPQSYRASLMYFHPLAVSAMKAAKKRKPDATKEDLEKVVNLVLAKRAEELGKTVDQLQDYEKLDTGNARFHQVSGHFKEGVGFVQSRLGMDGKEADEVWKQMGEPKSYLCTVLLLYPVNKEGEVNKKALFDNWDVKPWRFAGKVNEKLRLAAAGLKSNDLNIATQDLTLKCDNTDYQGFEIQPCGKSLWRRVSEDATKDSAGSRFQAEVLAASVKLYETMRKPFRTMSTADLAIKLGVSVGGASGGGGSDVDLDDFDAVLNQV